MPIWPPAWHGTKGIQTALSHSKRHYATIRRSGGMSGERHWNIAVDGRHACCVIDEDVNVARRRARRLLRDADRLTKASDPV